MKPLTEAQITRQIRDVLKLCGIFHWKQWQGPMSQPRGIADILGIYKGQMLAIEVKREKGIVTPEQNQFINRIKKEGGIAFVARSVEDVIKRLNLRIIF